MTPEQLHTAALLEAADAYGKVHRNYRQLPEAEVKAAAIWFSISLLTHMAERLLDDGVYRREHLSPTIELLKDVAAVFSSQADHLRNKAEPVDV